MKHLTALTSAVLVLGADRAKAREEMLMSRVPVAVVVLALALSLIVRAPGAAGAATLTVDDLADTSGGGTCTLRNAIDAANTNAAVGGCVRVRRAWTRSTSA